MLFSNENFIKCLGGLLQFELLSFHSNEPHFKMLHFLPLIECWFWITQTSLHQVHAAYVLGSVSHVWDSKVHPSNLETLLPFFSFHVSWISTMKVNIDTSISRLILLEIHMQPYIISCIFFFFTLLSNYLVFFPGLLKYNWQKNHNIFKVYNQRRKRGGINWELGIDIPPACVMCLLSSV